jgi:hypothetical protein
MAERRNGEETMTDDYRNAILKIEHLTSDILQVLASSDSLAEIGGDLDKRHWEIRDALDQAAGISEDAV